MQQVDIRRYGKYNLVLSMHQEVPMDLIGVRKAASMLGVHENTLRRWEEAGFVRAVKLPSGVRRFRPEDIDRLRNEMYDDIAKQALEEASASERNAIAS